MRYLVLFSLLSLASLSFGQNVGIGISTPQSKLHVKPNNAAALQIDPFGPAAGQTADLRFLEPTGAGTNFVGFKAPDVIPANVVWVLRLQMVRVRRCFRRTVQVTCTGSHCRGWVARLRLRGIVIPVMVSRAEFS
ncbi:MAG: hypothetical protein IPN95_26055 [Bacteroidetes bacterium]|nr:hypothetical protein [Bacteroidota bacterium]